MHKEASVTFNNPHIACVINTWRDQIKTKTKEEKYFTPVPSLLTKKGKLIKHNRH